LQKPVEKRGGGTENRRLPKSKKSLIGILIRGRKNAVFGGGVKKKSEFLLKATLRNSIFTNTTVTESLDSLKCHKYLSASSTVPKVIFGLIVIDILGFLNIA